jgi:hypothetical protein
MCILVVRRAVPESWGTSNSTFQSKKVGDIEISFVDYSDLASMPEKVQAILTLNPPNDVKELRQFLRMVQYYRDMWAKHSEMLSPLTDLVGACGENKATRKNKTKKLPWRWDPIHQQAFDDVKATIRKM